MKIHLKKSVESYDKIKDRYYLINPVSEVDAEIFVEIMQIFKKLGRSDLTSILDQWKYIKDSELRDQLLQWNIDNQESLNSKNKDSVVNPLQELIEDKSRVFLNINGFNYDGDNIFNFGEIDEWDFDLVCPKYGIILNEVPPETKRVPMYANKKIFFGSEVERDRILEQIRDWFIDNKEDEFLNFD